MINSARFAGDRAILEYSVKTLQMLMDKINCAVKDHGMMIVAKQCKQNGHNKV